MNSSAPEQPQNRSRQQLLLMLAIVALTLGGSYLLFLLAERGGLWGTVNKGEFVNPPASVTDYDWRTIEAAPFSREFPAAFGSPDPATPGGSSATPDANARESVKRTWWLLAVAADDCGDACQDALAHMRSLQILLTKDATRVRRALVLPGATRDALATQYPKLVQLSRQPTSAAPATGIYIVDPTGVLVLRYPLQGSAADIQKDLKRLLKYSQLG